MRKVFFHTFGCKVNQYETQLLREASAAGYTVVPGHNDADVTVINTCSVTGEAERQCRQLIRKILKDNPRCRIIVTGCYAVRSQEELRLISPSVEVAADKSFIFVDAGASHPSFITSFSEHSRAFIKIQDGCDAFCSYCIVPYVRPKLVSRPEAEILEEAKRLIERGYPEIVLTGIRLGKYSGGLTSVMEKLLKLPGNFRIRLSSLELSEVNRELLDLMSSNKDKLCAHLHIPLQSGSDAVLKLMNRPYKAAEFEKKLELVYKALPDAGVTTDVITGFPKESDEDFKKTFNLIERSRFSRLHVFTYSPRPGTPASRMDGIVPLPVAKERSIQLKELDKKLQGSFWRSFIGKRRQAVREGKKNTAITDNYIRVSIIDDSHSFINPIFTAEICDFHDKPGARQIF